jgi:hypothetical protein
MRWKINKQHNKRQKNENVRLYRFKRYITHPLRWTGALVILWEIPAILIMCFTNVIINFDRFTLFVLLPPAILFGLHGFYMIQRNEYIRHGGRYIDQGFPAKPFGYFLMISSWGASIWLVAGIVFHWH